MNTLLRAFVVLPIRIYQYCLSPLFPGHCRFRPTCSQYALEAVRMHGVFKGLFLAAHRLLRCHPWGGEGHDPVPPVVPSRHTRHI